MKGDNKKKYMKEIIQDNKEGIIGVRESILLITKEEDILKIIEEEKEEKRDLFLNLKGKRNINHIQKEKVTIIQNLKKLIILIILKIIKIVPII